jgi:DNA processing protein
LKLPYPSLAAFSLEACLRLLRSENVGPITFFELIRRFGTPEKAIEAIPEIAARGGAKNKYKLPSLASVQDEIGKAYDFGAEIIAYGSTYYPRMLANIYDPPPIFFCHGRKELLTNTDNIAVVGSRNASTNGKNLARVFSRDLGRSGLTVVSGLARGIDTAAHSAAMETGTIGVIAGGIDNVYPPENQEIYEQMRVEGLIISEQPFGSNPIAKSFPRRNRIISGLSLGVVVIEASLNSGSLITARLAAEQGRDVFAIPGSPLDPRSRGTNRLLRGGAILVESADDVVSDLGRQAPQDFFSPENSNQNEFALAEYSENALNKARIDILNALSAAPTSVENLASSISQPIGIIQTILLELELAGKVERLPGARVTLVI